MEIDLVQLRRAFELSQEQIAETLHVGQAAIAKLERRNDAYVSTLRRFIQAMGGELHIVARFPGQDFEIINFQSRDICKRARSLTKGEIDDDHIHVQDQRELTVTD
jgi:transcriptional regulator with XRE-family HTH domain